MLSNNQYFLSNTREECCKKFYGWDLYTCTGTELELTNGEYYPDWSGGSSTTSTCPNDSNMPNYMAKSMVTLASKSVLSEYWSSKVGQYSYGKLRVRGVQIRGDLSKVLNRCVMDVYCDECTPPVIVTDSNSAQREEHFKHIKA
eukprot:scaffold4531_cov140-Skeletonema_marinoi.AAC.1